MLGSRTMTTPTCTSWTRPALAPVLALVLGAAGAQQPAPGTDPRDGLPARLAAAVAAAAPDFWGAVLVAQAGRVVYAQGHGMQDHDAVPNGPHSVFDLGGLGAQATVLTALQLAAQRKLDLDARVSRVLGSSWPADKQAITVRQLIAHTSGLPREADWSRGAATRREAIDAIARTTLVGAPGAAASFSALNHVLLAAVCEIRGGDDFADLARRRVLKPAGFDDGGFTGERGLDESAMTYGRVPGQPRGARADALPWNWTNIGHRALLGSARDVHALLAAVTAGKFGDGDAVAPLFADLDGGDEYRVQALAVAGFDLVVAHGAVAGYRARYVLDRKSRSWIVLLADERGLEPVQNALLLALLAPPEAAPADAAAGAAAPAESLPGPASGTAPPEDLERFVGVFELPTGGTVEVRAQGGGLLVTGRGLVASARIAAGQWPPPGDEALLRRREDVAVARLARLLEGDAAVLADGFASDPARVEARALAQRLAAAGPVDRVEFVGSEVGKPKPGKPASSWLRVVRAGQPPAVLQATWDARQRWTALKESEEPAAFRAAFRLLRRDLAAAVIAGKPVTLTVEGTGAGRVLVLEDATPGPLGLVECRWAAR